MGKETCRFEAARAERRAPPHPEGETSGDYYTVRAASRETAGCIAAAFMLAGMLLVAALGIHSCATREKPAAKVGTLERPVIAQVRR